MSFAHQLSRILACWVFVAVVVAGTVRATTTPTKAYAVGIRDSFMIAHSFHGHPAFGPARNLHGATYTCDVEFRADRLHPDTQWVIDIGLASEMLSAVVAAYNYQNLDELFGSTVLTTTEFMCRVIHADLCERLKKECADFSGEVCVKLWESHKAWACYVAAV